MIEKNEITTIGKFQKTHALKGELNAVLEVDPEFLEEGNALIVERDGIYVPFYCESVRPKGTTTYLVKLEGIDSEEESRQFVNQEIYGLKNELAPFYELEEGELKSEGDLIGYWLKDDDGGRIIGKISGVDSSTSNLLFLVNSPDGETIYVPAAEDLICGIDDREKTITMTLPSGLVDLNYKQEPKGKK